MSLTSRLFCWEDVPALHALISDNWRLNGPNVSLHIGDLYWGLRPRPQCDPTKDIRLWTNSLGDLVGFCWFDHVESGSVVVRPDTDSSVVHEMLNWFEDEARASGCKSFATACFDTDDRRLDILRGRDYTRSKAGDPHLLIDLVGELQPPEPPEGYNVRSITGPEEIEGRAAVHRAAWSDAQPSAVTGDVYRRLVEMPAYRRDLDFVAIGPDGKFVSCTNVWYDEELRVAEFEPVGCHPDHRRKGVTRALLLSALRHLRNLGTEQAIVYTSSENQAARALYESCGFRVIGHDWYYTKQIE